MKDSDHLGADRGVDSRYLCARADGFSADIATLAAGWEDASVFAFTVTGKAVC